MRYWVTQSLVPHSIPRGGKERVWCLPWCRGWWSGRHRSRLSGWEACGWASSFYQCDTFLLQRLLLLDLEGVSASLALPRWSRTLYQVKLRHQPITREGEDSSEEWLSHSLIWVHCHVSFYCTYFLTLSYRSRTGSPLLWKPLRSWCCRGSLSIRPRGY